MKYNEMQFGQAEAIFNKLGGHDNVLGILRGDLVVTVTPKVLPPPPLILTPYSTIELPARVEKFVVARKFVVGKAMAGKNARPSIAHIDRGFKGWSAAKGEKPVGPRTLVASRFARGAWLHQIEAELGEEKSVTTLVDVYELLCRQPQGEDGILDPHRSTCFKVKDARGLKCVIVVLWRMEYCGWCIYKDYLGRWGQEGERFVSRLLPG